jgi:hypothetical protein
MYSLLLDSWKITRAAIGKTSYIFSPNLTDYLVSSDDDLSYSCTLIQ